MLSDYLFDTPWWLLVVLIGGGAAVWWILQLRRQRLGARVGLAVAAVGVGLLLSSYFVKTDKEKVVADTRRLLTAVETRDSKTLESLLHPAASLAGWRKQDIVYGAKIYADQYGVQSIAIRSIELEQNSDMITETLSIISHHDANKTMYSMFPSTWQFDWLKDGDKWVLKNISVLKFANIEQNQMNQQYFSRRP